jgi:hypothetical protein
LSFSSFSTGSSSVVNSSIFGSDSAVFNLTNFAIFFCLGDSAIFLLRGSLGLSSVNLMGLKSLVKDGTDYLSNASTLAVTYLYFYPDYLLYITRNFLLVSIEIKAFSCLILVFICVLSGSFSSAFLYYSESIFPSKHLSHVQ